MARARLRSRIPTAFLASGLLISSAGCAALDPLGLLAGGGQRTGLGPSPVPFDLPATLTTPGYDVFRVVAWVLATVAAALVLAFVAGMLNGRKDAHSVAGPPVPVEPTNRPASPGQAGPLTT